MVNLANTQIQISEIQFTIEVHWDCDLSVQGPAGERGEQGQPGPSGFQVSQSVQTFTSNSSFLHAFLQL